MTSGTGYTRELLAEAARQCQDIDEVIARYGIEPHPQRLKQYLIRRFDAYGIDVSHFKRRAYQRHGKPDEASLRDAVASSESWSGTLRHLGLPLHGRRTATLQTWVRASGLDTSHFLGQAHQRGKPGPVAARPASEILVRHDGTRRTTSRLLRRALREVGVPDVCDGCGTPPEWRGRPMTLEVDHIDGDWSDDRRENLRLLCPNCHAVTDTWCRGGARRSRT
ncbi:HNH endonuclease [Streptomyces sp. NBC_00536]|uniref:HNH endonuclease signature motif containing protein n=1 Tax=Streptomyces sp. NBC_00536 TaxID=2975769 RepID=UPI002E80662D|nr:HNH endonuclease [Streptomyces sp. NBC_00536]WUC79270.1 HNH endonuclease [Streptomyces sp. NBC_00536]